MLAFLEEVRCADVGRQHAFLDDAVGVVAFVGFDALDLAVVVEDHARLDGFEIDGAALFARLDQHAIERVEVFQPWQQGTDLFQRGCLLVVERGGNLGVSQSRVRPHHCRVEAVIA